MGNVTTTPVEPRPASSVILLRPADDGPKILYLRRNPALAFHGGYWVFPGGRIDAADYEADAPRDEQRAARRGAVREAREEAGVEVPESTLQFAAHWTTPIASRIRFATWFFVAPATDSEVSIDGGEIHDHRWLRPADALSAQRAGDMKLAAPTFALTTRLAHFPNVETAMAVVASWPPERLLGCLREVPGGLVAVYAQDVAYGNGQLGQPGRRHRLWMLESGWRYERTF